MRIILPWHFAFFKDYCDVIYWKKPENYPAPPDDLEASLNYILTTFPERERDIIHKRYADGITLSAIGEAYGISKERVRQIINAVFYKIRGTPTFQGIFLHGVEGYIAKQVENRVASTANVMAERLLKKEREKTRAEEEEKNKTREAQVLSTPISNLPCSPRVQRLLIENGYETVADIMKCKGPDDLLAIPRMGKGSLTSLVNTLKMKGIDAEKLRLVEKNTGSEICCTS